MTILGNKPRLYVVLLQRHAQLSPDSTTDDYHWALMIGPKTERARSPIWQIRMVERDRWRTVRAGTLSTEERCGRLADARRVLVRICVAKVLDVARAKACVRRCSLRDYVSHFDGLTWVRDALEKLGKTEGALGTRVRDWETISGKAMEFVREKIEGRRFAEYGEGWVGDGRPPTWDLLTGVETVA